MRATIPLGGNIVKDYYIGNTHIYICDAAYVNNDTPEAKKRILDDAAQASLEIIRHNQQK
mgnify:CR=1 FL=1